MATVRELEDRGFGFRSPSEGIDTASGALVFHVFGALAQFKRDLTSEWTMAGLAAARAERRVEGRSAEQTDAGAAPQAEAMLRDLKGYPFVSDVIRSLSIGGTAAATTSRRSGSGNSRAEGMEGAVGDSILRASKICLFKTNAERMCCAYS